MYFQLGSLLLVVHDYSTIYIIIMCSYEYSEAKFPEFYLQFTSVPSEIFQHVSISARSV